MLITGAVILSLITWGHRQIRLQGQGVIMPVAVSQAFFGNLQNRFNSVNLPPDRVPIYLAWTWWIRARKAGKPKTLSFLHVPSAFLSLSLPASLSPSFYIHSPFLIFLIVVLSPSLGTKWVYVLLSSLSLLPWDHPASSLLSFFPSLLLSTFSSLYYNLGPKEVSLSFYDLENFWRQWKSFHSRSKSSPRKFKLSGINPVNISVQASSKKTFWQQPKEKLFQLLRRLLRSLYESIALPFTYFAIQ